MEDKNTTAMWMEVDIGLKALVDFVLKLADKSRKDYVTELIEDDVYSRLSSVPGIEDILTRLGGASDHSLVEAYKMVERRVKEREVIPFAEPVSPNLATGGK